MAGTILAAFASTGLTSNASRSRRSKSAAVGILQSPAATRGLAPVGQKFWAQTRGPQGGDGITLATNSNGHLSGTQGGGVFRSTDNAETWSGISNGLTATNVRALAISPVDHIFAGTLGVSSAPVMMEITGLQ